MEAQIQLQREAAQADIDIKREKARVEMAIAAFKAQQWAEIVRIKVAARASVRPASGGGDPGQSSVAALQRP
jgi:hypothetical protein